MGNTFSNISIKKNQNSYSKDEIKHYLVSLMNNKGFYLVDSKSKFDVIFSVKVNISSNWITFYSDEYDCDPIMMNDYGTQFSKIFKSPVLCIYCNDSDFLLLNLIESKIKLDTIAYVGHPYDDIDFTSIDYNLFEPYFIKKEMKEKFRDTCESDYVFVEEALNPIGEILGFQPSDINMSLSELEDCSITYKFYFSKSTSNLKEVDKELVNIKLKLYPLFPAFLDQPHLISYLNHGASSKGLAIYFIGEYVKDDLITFSLVELGYCDYKSKKYRDRVIRIPLELKKTQLKDGNYAYYAECPDFEIPEKVDSSLPAIKHFKEENVRSFFVRFIPQGSNKNILDISVVVFPLQRKENLLYWNVWDNGIFGSKEACIDNYNKFQVEVQKNSIYEYKLMDKDYYLK